MATQRPSWPSPGPPANRDTAASRAPPRNRTATTGRGRRSSFIVAFPSVPALAGLVVRRRLHGQAEPAVGFLVEQVLGHDAVVPAVPEVDDHAEGQPDDQGAPVL